MRNISRISILTMASMALVLSACSGGSADRPSAQELADAAQASFGENLGGALPDDQALCLGEVMFNSPLSNEALVATVNNTEGYEPTSEEQTWLSTTYVSESADCFGLSGPGSEFDLPTED